VKKGTKQPGVEVNQAMAMEPNIPGWLVLCLGGYLGQSFSMRRLVALPSSTIE